MKSHMLYLFALVLFCNLLLFLTPASTHLVLAQTTGTTVRVSLAPDGTEANGGSWGASLSDNGRHVVFTSDASNLVSDDTNDSGDVFVHDMQTGRTTRVSVSSEGTQGNSSSYSYGSITSDGRYVAFGSKSTNLVSGDTNNFGDVFVHDLLSGQTYRASVASDGTQGNYDSGVYGLSLSDDGRHVAFTSRASNLVSGDTNNDMDVFVHDRVTGQTIRASVASDGTPGNYQSGYGLSLSADGRYVAFTSYANNLVSNDTNLRGDIFLHDIQTGDTTRISKSSGGIQGNSDSGSPAISADGRYVAFRSYSTNLVSGETSGYHDVFLHNIETGETARVSVECNCVQGNSMAETLSISDDGRYVAYTAGASNLVSGDTNGTWDEFVTDMQTGETIRVSVASDGTQSNGRSYISALSGNGRYVAFTSEANNLVSSDTNNWRDIFIYDRQGQSCSSNVDMLKQTDYPNTQYDGIPYSIAAKGCLLTSWTMLINHFGASTEFSTDPQTLNQWLITHNGYDSAGFVINDAVAMYARNNGVELYFQGWIANDPSTLDAYLCNGMPVIVEEPGHFILATGKTVHNGTWTYAINDPAYNRSFLTDYANSYNNLALYSTTPTDPRRLIISAHSPVELLVIDPSGRRTGYDSATGTVLNEIPGSIYVRQTLADATNPNGVVHESKTFWAPAIEDGNYTVKVIGTGQGSFILDSIGYSEDGTSSFKTMDGNTNPGQTQQMQLSYSASTGVGSISTPTSTPTGTATSTPTATPTDTATATPTTSPTDTTTATATATQTTSVTPTMTPTTSPTLTATDTATFTPTATRTPTKTLTPTPTTTQTPTKTLTRTATSTLTCTTKPDSPVLTKPKNNGVVKKLKAKLDWNDASCANTYTVIVREGSKKGPKVQTAKNLTISQFKTKTLTPGKTYFWRVTASNDKGNMKSVWRSFTVQ